MSRGVEDEERRRRTKHPFVWALGISCYVLAVITGLYFLADDAGLLLLVPLWIAHAVLLVLFLRNLGARASSGYAMLFIVATSLMSVYIGDMARDNLTLQQRGETVTATVVEEWRDPAQGRKARFYNYALERQDGSKVPGPALRDASDRFDVGDVVTVVEDPEGELRPRTPGDADAMGDALGAGAFALGALGAVGWMTWRGSDAAKRREARKRPEAGDATHEAQEAKLRVALRTHPRDRRGYIKISPGEYPDISHHRAARIAWETGLRAEAMGNRGAWRFAEKVIEEVPND